MLGEVFTGPKSYGLKVIEQKFQPRSHSIFKPLSTRDPTPESGRVDHGHELTSLCQSSLRPVLFLLLFLRRQGPSLESAECYQDAPTAE